MTDFKGVDGATVILGCFPNLSKGGVDSKGKALGCYICQARRRIVAKGSRCLTLSSNADLMMPQPRACTTTSGHLKGNR